MPLNKVSKCAESGKSQRHRSFIAFFDRQPPVPSSDTYREEMTFTLTSSNLRRRRRMLLAAETLLIILASGPGWIPSFVLCSLFFESQFFRQSSPSSAAAAAPSTGSGSTPCWALPRTASSPRTLRSPTGPRSRSGTGRRPC